MCFLMKETLLPNLLVSSHMCGTSVFNWILPGLKDGGSQ